MPYLICALKDNDGSWPVRVHLYIYMYIYCKTADNISPTSSPCSCIIRWIRLIPVSMRPFIVGDTDWRLLENGVAMATASHERCYLVCGVTRLIEGSVGGGGGCPEMSVSPWWRPLLWLRPNTMALRVSVCSCVLVFCVCSHIFCLIKGSLSVNVGHSSLYSAAYLQVSFRAARVCT